MNIDKQVRFEIIPIKVQVPVVGDDEKMTLVEKERFSPVGYYGHRCVGSLGHFTDENVAHQFAARRSCRVVIEESSDPRFSTSPFYVSITGPVAGNFVDSFVSESAAKAWAIDVLVAYFNMAFGDARKLVEYVPTTFTARMVNA